MVGVWWGSSGTLVVGKGVGGCMQEGKPGVVKDGRRNGNKLIGGGKEGGPRNCHLVRRG